MYLKRPAGGLAFCLFYLASSFTNKLLLAPGRNSSVMYGLCSENESAIQMTAFSIVQCVHSMPHGLSACYFPQWLRQYPAVLAQEVLRYVLSVLQFTYPTLFQGSEILSWLPASVLFVGIIYAGSRALSRLPIPVFLTMHNAAEVITCGFQKFVQKEVIDLLVKQTSHLKVCSVLFLLAAAVCLPMCDTQEMEELSLFIVNYSWHPFTGRAPMCGEEGQGKLPIWTVGILSDVAHSEAKKQHNLRAICSLEFPCKGGLKTTTFRCGL
ncbi:hypothetical protein DV515_00000200 [Chloebia gouldiae]|uniref:Uncharacterized protein n=1 Tax=Chloebia gouldiae TaxID=44316 RepID=A0A3L8T0Y5_CHLGU|nr:hypothetical protein DV515_00000200 [Chloebia gouldiae]